MRAGLTAASKGDDLRVTRLFRRRAAFSPSSCAAAASRPCWHRRQGGRTAVTRLVCYFGGGSRQSEPGKPARRPALASCEAGCKGMAPSVTFNRWPWGGRNMEMLVLILAIAMVVPFPLEE